MNYFYEGGSTVRDDDDTSHHYDRRSDRWWEVCRHQYSEPGSNQVSKIYFLIFDSSSSLCLRSCICEIWMSSLVPCGPLILTWCDVCILNLKVYC